MTRLAMRRFSKSAFGGNAVASLVGVHLILLLIKLRNGQDELYWSVDALSISIIILAFALVLKEKKLLLAAVAVEIIASLTILVVLGSPINTVVVGVLVAGALVLWAVNLAQMLRAAKLGAD